MKNQWRLLLRRHFSLPASNICRTFCPSLHQVHTSPTSSFLSSLSLISLLHPRTTHPLPITPAFQSPTPRYFSSEFALDHKVSEHSLVIDIFSKSITGDEIKRELESNSIVISHELVLNVLHNLESTPVIASKFFDWVLEREGARLSSKSYNLILRILGINGFVKEFWDMVGVMKKKGYGVSKGTYVKVSECFDKEGLEVDLEKLRGLFSPKNVEDSLEMVASRVSKIVRQEVWDDVVEKKLLELTVSFSSDLVRTVLENLRADPIKALIFFRWVEESGLIKHDEQTYNAMAMVLGREDCIDRFWNVVGEMRNAGSEMERGTYVKVLNVFIRRRMIKDAVDLYEYAMNGANKPVEHDFTFLLKKIVVSKELNMELFSKVVKVFADSGNVLANSTMDAVLKSLTSVGRTAECNEILEVMVGAGLKPSSSLQGKIAFCLSSNERGDKASEVLQNLEASGCNLDYRTWTSLVEGHCSAGHLDKAFECLQKLVEKERISSAGYALDVLVRAYCNRDRATEACNLLCELVSLKDLKPWHSTYKTLISKLLVQRAFKDALNLLPLMKSHGFPPFLDPFIEYVSKRGTADEAIILLKAMTVKKFPSSSVFLRVFESFFRARRHDEAQTLLGKCPRYIRNHADVFKPLLFHAVREGRHQSCDCSLICW
ncbi:hypothetical protein Ancab_006503 [Ancistrocladus abbreviatus]